MKKHDNKDGLKCREELVYLYRSGELTDKERESLQDHLKLCSSCREIYEGLKQYDEAVRWISSESAELNADTLRQAIFSRIGRSEKKDRKRTGTSILFSSGMQYLVASVVIFLVLLFLYQNIMMLNKVSRLEKHLAASGEVHKPISTIDFSTAFACLSIFQNEDAKINIERISPECQKLLRRVGKTRSNFFRGIRRPALLKYKTPVGVFESILQSYSKGMAIQIIQ